jgi:ABC-type phosphate transport system substrate-binding protein
MGLRVPPEGVRRRGRVTTAAVCLGLAAVAAGAAAGCSASEEAAEADGAVTAADPAAAVRAAAEVLVGAGSSRWVTSMETASGGTRVAIRGTGTFDYVTRRGRLRISLPRDAAGAPEHRPITELLTPGALFIKDRGEGVPADKWVRVDTRDLSDGNLVTGGATDPLTAAELLRAVHGAALVGEERLDGVAVRHYRGTTDIARAARSASPQAREALRAAARGFAVTRVPFDAYLDERGRLRKVRQRFTFGNVAVVSVTRLSGFGTSVRVALPEAADIYPGKIVSSTGVGRTGHP